MTVTSLDPVRSALTLRLFEADTPRASIKRQRNCLSQVLHGRLRSTSLTSLCFVPGTITCSGRGIGLVGSESQVMKRKDCIDECQGSHFALWRASESE